METPGSLHDGTADAVQEDDGSQVSDRRPEVNFPEGGKFKKTWWTWRAYSMPTTKTSHLHSAHTCTIPIGPIGTQAS